LKSRIIKPPLFKRNKSGNKKRSRRAKHPLQLKKNETKTGYIYL
jgi:hypothetical protein